MTTGDCDGLDLVLVGQILLRTDLRLTVSGRRALHRARRLTATTLRNLLVENAVSRPSFVLGELEAAVCSACAVVPCAHACVPRSGPCHTSPVGVLDCLSALGIRVVATANNHTGDLGPLSLLGLHAELRLRGMLGVGSGRNLADAAAPGYHRLPCGRCVAVVSVASKVPDGYAAGLCTPGVFHLEVIDEKIAQPCDLKTLLASIAEARQHASFVIVCHHNHHLGGRAAHEPGSGVPPAWQQSLARQCADAGADAYVGHGEPRLQGIEMYGQKPLMYCLGNFMFQTRKPYGYYGPEVWESVAAHISPNGSDVRLALVPVVLHEPRDILDATRGLPRKATGGRAQAILERLAVLSMPLGTTIMQSKCRRSGQPIGVAIKTSV